MPISARKALTYKKEVLSLHHNAGSPCQYLSRPTEQAYSNRNKRVFGVVYQEEEMGRP